MEQETVEIQITSDLVDLLAEFKTDYIDVMLERRDQLWHKRKGIFIDEKETAVYEETRIKCDFLMNLYNAMGVTISNVGVAGDAMEDYLKTVEKLKIVEDGKWRSELFAKQTEELNRVTDKIKKRYSYFTATYKNIEN